MYLLRMTRMISLVLTVREYLERIEITQASIQNSSDLTWNSSQNCWEILNISRRILARLPISICPTLPMAAILKPSQGLCKMPEKLHSKPEGSGEKTVEASAMPR